MEGMTLQKKTGGKLRGPAMGNEVQVILLIASVNFIANNGVPQVGQVNTDLVHAPRVGGTANKSHGRQMLTGRHTAQHLKHRTAGSALGVATLAHVDAGGCNILHP